MWPNPSTRLAETVRGDTTLDLHITAGIITAEFVRIDSDVPSLSVMSLKIKK